VQTPVAVVREWQFPYDGRGWGVFVGSAQRHVLRTVGLMHFDQASSARAAADNEVGRWQKSEEWNALFWRRKRPKGWWHSHD
jgi:hypothetical protein